jgi:hypothetical protein
MQQAHDNAVSVQANLARERQVKSEARSRPEPKPGRRALLDHYDDAGARWTIHVEAAMGVYGRIDGRQG